MNMIRFMKNIILILALFSTHNLFAADIFTNMAFKQKISGIYQKALNCNPLEVDMKTSMNATDWMSIMPQIPDAIKLAKLSGVANEAKIYAQSKQGSDKVQHCYAGCYVGRKLGYESAVMVGWLKELLDSSDCSADTHFEHEDYLATVAGGLIAHKLIICEHFCGSKSHENLDGSEMLEAAKRM